MLNVDHLGCVDSVPLRESKNGFLIQDLPDFVVERKSEIGFVTLVTFRKRVQYARQPLKKWHVFYCLTNRAIIPCRILWSAVRITRWNINRSRKKRVKVENYRVCRRIAVICPFYLIVGICADFGGAKWLRRFILLSFFSLACTVTVSAVDDNFQGENGDKLSQQNGLSYIYLRD